MGAKAIKLGSWDKHPAYCEDWNVNEWHMHNERICDEVCCYMYFTLVEFMVN